MDNERKAKIKELIRKQRMVTEAKRALRKYLVNESKKRNTLKESDKVCTKRGGCGKSKLEATSKAVRMKKIRTEDTIGSIGRLVDTLTQIQEISDKLSSLLSGSTSTVESARRRRKMALESIVKRRQSQWRARMLAESKGLGFSKRKRCLGEDEDVPAVDDADLGVVNVPEDGGFEEDEADEVSVMDLVSGIQELPEEELADIIRVIAKADESSAVDFDEEEEEEEEEDGEDDKKATGSSKKYVKKESVPSPEKEKYYKKLIDELMAQI